MERKHIDKIYNDLRVRLKKNRFTHNLSGKHYKSLFQCLTFPSIFITALISSGGFLVSAQRLNFSVTNGITLSIGFLGILNTALQTILTNCEYETKNKMFQKAADSYDKLITTLDFDYNNIHIEEDYDSFYQELKIMEGKILKIKDDCSYLPPLFIIEKWQKHKKNYIIQNDIEYDVDENTELITAVNNRGGKFETV